MHCYHAVSVSVKLAAASPYVLCHCLTHQTDSPRIESPNKLELGIIDSNQFDRVNRIHVEFDSSVWFQLQKARHNM